VPLALSIVTAISVTCPRMLGVLAMTHKLHIIIAYYLKVSYSLGKMRNGRWVCVYVNYSS
jgi:hypothetical protein